MIREVAAAALVLLPAMARAQTAQEDPDLARIPQGPAQPPAPVDTRQGVAASAHVYIEDALSVAHNRSASSAIVPAGPAIRWFDLLFADARFAQPLGNGWTINYGGRVNVQIEKYAALPAGKSFRLDTREAYLSWAPREGWFVDAGRINLKSGVALGYNPTDFFRTRAVVEALSSDPAVLRDDRLGALMLRIQAVWPRVSVTVAYAPSLYRPSPIYQNRSLPRFDPMLDRTNAADRLLVKVNAKISDEFSPEILLYSENGRTVMGLNLTRGIGRSVVLYAEWAGGRRRNLISEAIGYGRATNSLLANVGDILPTNRKTRFMNDLAIGASYTTSSKIVFNLEYHYHQAALDPRDWRHWFDAGSAARANPGIGAALWYVRGYAADQQEPASRRSLFLRVDRQDAIVRNLELSAFANLDTADGSGFTEGEADYFLSDRLTLGAIAKAGFGARRSEFGSQPQALSLLLKVARYF